jgi:hypothetical protein
MIDSRVKNRIEHFVQNQINDFSPTISPAPKNYERNEVESLYEGIQYFLNNGIDELLIQKKYMGSYCSIYLKKNHNDTYLVSRNGHLINYIDNEAANKSLEELHAKMLILYPEFKTMIIASELLPWSAMGKGLIEREYLAYHDAYKTHFEYLSESDLYEKIEKVKSSPAYIEYIADTKSMKESEVKKKYKPLIVRQYNSMTNMKILDLKIQEESLAIYHRQISHFGVEQPIHFKPFTILKIINNDGKEFIPNSNLTYAEVNNDTFLHLKFDENNHTDNIEKAYSFFNQLTELNEEGVMIKPVQAYHQGLAPCLKVRNDAYLTMIYGINLAQDYGYYLNKRNIKRKLEQSIIDWKINNEMLHVKYKNINSENYLMKLLVLKRIEQEDIESTLDKRL